MLILGALPAIFGVAAGVIVTGVGISALRSQDPDDKKPGAIVTASGVLAILSKLGGPFRPLAGVCMGIGAVGLLVMGIWNGIKFIKGLRDRSS
jgi:hypothetical protein